MKLRNKALVIVSAAVSLGVAAWAVTNVQGVRVFLPSGWTLAPTGNQVATGDLLAGGERSPNGKWISFVSVGQGAHRLYVVDANTGDMAAQTELPRGWIGMAWAPDSSELFVSGGTTQILSRFSVGERGELSKGEPIKLPNVPVNKGWLSGLAIIDGHAFVGVAAGDALMKIDLKTGSVVKKLDFAEGASPYQVRASKGKIYVSLQGAEKVACVDAEEMTLVGEISTGRHPNDLLIHGDRLFVACGNDDIVDVFDTYTMHREERIVTRPWPEAPIGSTPHALAISLDGETLYVANSDNNAVAVVDTGRRGASRVEGFIPTAVYPSALGTLKDGRLMIGSAKGWGTGPNGKTDTIDPIAPQGYPYIVTLLNGTLALVDARDPKKLEQFTKTVLSVSKYKPGMVEKPFQAPARGSSPVPSRLGDESPIKHVLYIIKENRTYDQLFGDLKRNGKPYGNGEPKLTLFGEDVAPNHRKLALDYVLLDNLYASGEVSVDGHHWTNGAYVPDFMQRTWPQQYSGKGAPRLTPELAATPNDRIWDQVRRAGKSYRTYYYHTKDRMSEEWSKARQARVRDYEAVDIFIREFREFEEKKTMPSFMVMALSEDHTTGTRPGTFTPQAAVGSNDYGLGKLVEAISNSSYWSKFAIFVIEDDAQNGPDHVDAHRTVGLVISPYTRYRGLDSTMYTTTSMVRTMGLILGTNPMSQHDAAATPMYKAFHSKPDMTPYRAVKPKTDLLAINPPRPQDPLVAAIDFSIPDQLTLAQEIALNRDIWRSAKGTTPYPGAVRRFGIGGPEEGEDD